MTREYSADVWSKEISFYLDGMLFKCSRNPSASAKCTWFRVLRKVHEGKKVDLIVGQVKTADLADFADFSWP